MNLSIGDKFLVKTKLLHKTKSHYFSAELIKQINNISKKILGISNLRENKKFINPTNNFFDYPINFTDDQNTNFKENQIIELEIPIKSKDNNLLLSNIKKTYGNTDRSDLFSYLSIKEYGLPEKFTDSVMNEINNIKRKKSPHEIDLTYIPFVTIDPENAKDRDDAIFANFPNSLNDNKVFCELWIAIADVSSFFKIRSNIDDEALSRGNSTYLKDTVIPMLPKKLSNELCSLEENAIRHAVTLKVSFDKNGNKFEHKFFKSKINVKYNLNYEEVEELIKKEKKGNHSKISIIKNLNKAYKFLENKTNNPLNIKISEPMIETNIFNKSLNLVSNKSLNSHKLVENFMIIANICVGETLSKSNFPVIYRHHEKPTVYNLNKLNRTLKMLGISSSEKKNEPIHFNSMLNENTDKDLKNLISIIILQNMSQAYYSKDYSGHYGLSLKKYVHFTSPIRRYADLLVHRQLHLYLGWDLDEKEKINLLRYNQISAHISSTERKSIKAEKQTHSRYIANYMKHLLNDNFTAVIYNILNSKVFFFLRENYIQGSCIYKEFQHDKRKKFKRKKEIKKSNFSLSIGDLISVKLISANDFNGNLVFEFQHLLKKFKNKN